MVLPVEVSAKENSMGLLATAILKKNNKAD